jgi:hypothetical protein
MCDDAITVKAKLEEEIGRFRAMWQKALRWLWLRNDSKQFRAFTDKSYGKCKVF